MPNPHEHPTALEDLQNSIYREKILRARAMTREERIEGTAIPYIENWCATHKTTQRLYDTLARIPPL